MRSNGTTPAIGVLLAVAATLGVGACSSDGDEPTELSDTTEVSETTEAPDEPDGPETTEVEATTTTVGGEEGAVREVHTRFMVELLDYDERTDDPQQFLALAEELTVGAQLQRIRDRVDALPELDDRYAGPGYESNIVEVTLSDGFATVLDCSLDQGSTYSIEGELLDGPSDEYQLRETQLVLEGDRWLISDFRTGGGETCEP